jgi:hypothetical protein
MQLVGILWFIVVVFALVLKFFTSVRVSRIWLVLAGLAPVISVNIVNPLFRVWSFHSLMHGGIVYQILNGNIPPPAPLVGGTPLRYPWGAHLLAAAMCKAANITPFTSIAVINVASLLASLVLAYKISKTLFDDEIANILSPLVAFFATSLGPGRLVQMLPDAIPTEFRGIPLLGKYCTTNALPLGVVFMLLFQLSALRLFAGRPAWRYLLLAACSIAGCGFFYAPFLPGIVAGAGLAFLLSLGLGRVGSKDLRLKEFALLMAVVAGCLLALRPYLASIGGGIMSQAVWFAPVWIGRNLLRYLVVTVPLLLVVLFAWNRLKAALRHQGLLFMLAMVAGNLVCYLFIHLPFKGEYKFLLISLITLGVLGGIAFRILLDRSRMLVLVVLAALLLQAVTIIARTSQGRKEQYHYLEKGTALETTHAQREELYEWIRTHTPTDAIFLDDDIEIPALAQRQLYIPPREFWGLPPRRGYGQVNDVLDLQSGYVPDLLEHRAEVLKEIYDPGMPLTGQELEEIRNLPGPAYIVSSGPRLKAKFDADLEEVFHTSAGTYQVYLVPE